MLGQFLGESVFQVVMCFSQSSTMVHDYCTSIWVVVSCPAELIFHATCRSTGSESEPSAPMSGLALGGDVGVAFRLRRHAPVDSAGEASGRATSVLTGV